MIQETDYKKTICNLVSDGRLDLVKNANLSVSGVWREFNLETSSLLCYHPDDQLNWMDNSSIDRK